MTHMSVAGNDSPSSCVGSTTTLPVAASGGTRQGTKDDQPPASCCLRRPCRSAVAAWAAGPEPDACLAAAAHSFGGAGSGGKVVSGPHRSVPLYPAEESPAAEGVAAEAAAGLPR